VPPALTLTVRETGPGDEPYYLTGEQLAALIAVPDLVRLTPAPGGRWHIRGNQKVGRVHLRTASGASIHLTLRPKLTIQNLLFLLAYSPTDPWHPAPVTAATADDLLPALADLLARTAQRTLETGVLHGYRETADDLPLIRGRIRTTAQLRRTGLPLPIAVQYDDHTPDIAENRILLSALHLAAQLPGVPQATLRTLRHLTDRLHGVRRLHGEPLPTWTPTRLNARYTQALRLAELLLAGRSLQPERGAPVRTDGFLLDMPRVFERFLTLALRAALTRHGIRCEDQERHHRLDQAGRALIRPDLVLYRKGRPISVVDAKYKALNPTAPPVEHLYQLLSYCTALSLPRGHLVYATTTDNASPATHAIRNSPTTITTHALNLAKPPQEVLARITALATETGIPHA
jgi:5-methylcytosine-specific restriction enzyme subunit McrC